MAWRYNLWPNDTDQPKWMGEIKTVKCFKIKKRNKTKKGHQNEIKFNDSKCQVKQWKQRKPQKQKKKQKEEKQNQ